MTITSTSSAVPRQAPARAGGRSRPARGEGQWALGYREPLNKNEETKKNDDGLHVRQRIIDIYSKNGFDSIDPADLRGRFRWFGLYTQRKPGISGGKTATLEPEELDDRYFMLRVRIDGGQLDYDQLTTIADISRRYARGTAGVTDPDGTPGYDLWVGGGLSTNPMIGKRLGAFVRPDQVEAVWAGVTGIFRDYGYRRLRHRARIKFLIADWGPERFREVLERDYLGFQLADGPAPEPTAGRSRDHVGIHPQKDGLFFVG